LYKDRQSKSTKTKFTKEDVLYGKLRPYLNKVVVAPEDGYCTTEIVPIRCSKAILPRYLCYVLKSPFFGSYVNNLTYGVKMPRLGRDDATMAPIPLTSLEEQHRLVVKIDRLMQLCDNLEQQQRDLSKLRAKLASSICHQISQTELIPASGDERHSIKDGRMHSIIETA
jgi:type I restriction enzyme S subunit